MEFSNDAKRKAHELKIVCREKANLTGIEKVISSSETALLLVSTCGTLSVAGEKLKIIKFDADSGILDFEGSVSAVKYAAAKKPLLKRIFK